MFFGLTGTLAPVELVIAITLIVGSGLIIEYGYVYGYSYALGQDKNNQGSNSNQYVPFELPLP